MIRLRSRFLEPAVPFPSFMFSPPHISLRMRLMCLMRTAGAICMRMTHALASCRHGGLHVLVSLLLFVVYILLQRRLPLAVAARLVCQP